jgi:nitrogen fixation NifU-like protein
MSAADDLYDAEIKSLAAKASALGPVDHAACRHEADNFLCGDRARIEIGLKDGTVDRVGGKIRGCLLVQAAAALIAETAPGLDRAALKEGVSQARALMERGVPATGRWQGLNAFTPVHDLKHRHECVLLPFEAVKACLDQTPGGGN